MARNPRFQNSIQVTKMRGDTGNKPTKGKGLSIFLVLIMMLSVINKFQCSCGFKY